MKFKHIGIKKIILGGILFLLSIFLLVTLVQIIYNLRLLKHEGIISRKNFHKSTSLPQLSDIQSWMTFRYINVVFGLPPEYLKNELGITDRSYPNISISALAKKQRQTPMQLLTDTQSAVGKFLQQKIETTIK